MKNVEVLLESNKCKKFVLASRWLLFWCCPEDTYGMADEPLLNLSLKNVAIKDALWEIEKQSKMVFVYNADDLGKAGRSP
ncbi:MAG: hypothetical protein ACLUDU_12145 [Butyricimonas faecihominis]